MSTRRKQGKAEDPGARFAAEPRFLSFDDTTTSDDYSAGWTSGMVGDPIPKDAPADWRRGYADATEHVRAQLERGA